MDEDLKKLIEETSAETHRRFDEVVGELRQENVQTRQHFDVVAGELRKENVETRQRFDEAVGELRQENVETRQHIDVVAAELRQEVRVATSDLRRHFDVTAEDFRHQVQQVAEGVDTVNERVDQLTRDMKHEFAETNAMIRISYSDLDRRLRSLEDRVERLESSARPQ